MCFRVERTTIAALLVLAFCQDLRVSSLDLPKNGPPSEYVFPGDYEKNENLGYFGNVDDNYTAQKCNESDESEKVGTIVPLVGGRFAKIGQFPWMAIIHQLVGGGRIGLCGGTIISVRWVLTAGHCVANGPQRFLIVLGDVNKAGIGYDTYKGPGQAMITTKGALHPRYSPQENDIALLWMPQSIKFNNVIQPIRLAGRNEAHRTFAREMGVVVGWGRESPNQSGGSQRLKFLSLPIIENRECARTWNVRDSNVCTATGSNSDACQGDSGGPLIVTMGGRYIQIGIVSYGDKHCSSILPGVFTRVSSFAAWIKQVTAIQYR